MINILIANNNINFAVDLMNYLCNNSNIRVCNIAKNGKEVIEILNNFNDIDVILLDYKMPFYNVEEILAQIKDKNKYEKSFILISSKTEADTQFYNNNMIYSFIHKTNSREKIISIINELVNSKYILKQSVDLKSKIINELNYLGYDMSYKGTHYLIKSIEYIMYNPHKDLEKLEKNIYPMLATFYNNSIHNIKCNINRANNIMYYECESEKLQKYFSFHKDTKPKIKTVIHTIINKIS